MATAVGFVAPGFEPVRELFEQHLRAGIEEHAQCCAFVGGVKVVELHGSAKPSRSRRSEYDVRVAVVIK